MLYFNQQPNLTTTFNFVTSSLLLDTSGFQYRWVFNHKLSPRTSTWPLVQAILQQSFAKSLREKKKKLCEDFYFPVDSRDTSKTMLISFSYHMPGFLLIEVAPLYHLTPIIIGKTMTIS